MSKSISRYSANAHKQNVVQNTVAIFLIIMLSGCAVGPDFISPEIDTSDSFQNVNEAHIQNSAVLKDWWKLFNDSLLTSLVSRAVDQNLDYKVALSRIREARALRTVSLLDFFPAVTSGAAYTRQRISHELFQSAAGNASSRDGDLFSAGFDATWELDIFGHVRRSYEANDATLDAVNASADDVLVSVVAEVAQTYFELRGLQEQLSVAKRNAENQRETVRLTEVLQSGGTVTEFDTARARAQYEQTQATIPQFEASVERAKNRLAVLLGAQPGVLDSELNPEAALPQVPANVGVENPKSLLERRPDVRTSEALLHAATARVGIATADLFPRATFVGSVGVQATSFSNLSTGAGEYAFGPRLSWPAFDIGRTLAERSAADARLEAALIDYQRTVLGALKETDDALITFGREQVRTSHLERARDASHKSVEIARERYQTGVADFLSVLDAEARALSVDLQLAESQTTRLTALVAVYKALGGVTEETKTGATNLQAPVAK